MSYFHRILKASNIANLSTLEPELDIEQMCSAYETVDIELQKNAIRVKVTETDFGKLEIYAYRLMSQLIPQDTEISDETKLVYGTTSAPKTTKDYFLVALTSWFPYLTAPAFQPQYRSVQVATWASNRTVREIRTEYVAIPNP
jgi:hypothetical protein